MTLEMRDLKGDDLFTLLSIVGKMDIKDEFIGLFKDNAETATVLPTDRKKKQPTKAELAKQEAEAEERGMQAMAGILQKVLLNAGKLKGDINTLLSEMTGEPLRVIQDLSLNDYMDLIFAFFGKPELKGFFSRIASLLQ